MGNLSPTLGLSVEEHYAGWLTGVLIEVCDSGQKPMIWRETRMNEPFRTRHLGDERSAQIEKKDSALRMRHSKVGLPLGKVDGFSIW
jgi:hypothetical protein